MLLDGDLHLADADSLAVEFEDDVVADVDAEGGLDFCRQRDTSSHVDLVGLRTRFPRHRPPPSHLLLKSHFRQSRKAHKRQSRKAASGFASVRRHTAACSLARSRLHDLLARRALPAPEPRAHHDQGRGHGGRAPRLRRLPLGRGRPGQPHGTGARGPGAGARPRVAARSAGSSASAEGGA